MEMDWSWFFSSLSQSAAAIVGIFGAFIITKTLSNQTSYTEKSIKLENIIADSENIKNEASGLYIEWYNTRVRDSASEKLLNLLNNPPEDLELDPEQLFFRSRYSLYDDREEVLEIVETVIAPYKQYVENEQQKDILSENEAARSVAAILSDLENHQSHKPDYPLSTVAMDIDRRQRADALRLMVEEEQDKITAVHRKVIHQIKLNQNFGKTIVGDPESSRYITIILCLITILFFAGVIYPVSFLPVAIGATPSPSASAILPTLLSFKGIMLTVISVIFCAIPGLFLILNNSFKYSRPHIETLNKYSKIGEYSKFFQNHEENMFEKSKRNTVS